MTKADHTASERLRIQAVTIKASHPSWSLRDVAQRVGCSPGFVRYWTARDQQLHHVHDHPRSGRPPKADAAAVQHVLETAQLTECRSSADIAAYVKQHFGLQISRWTVQRLLRANGLTFLSPKAVPFLSEDDRGL